MTNDMLIDRAEVFLDELFRRRHTLSTEQRIRLDDIFEEFQEGMRNEEF